jgi:hypothetical protein
VGDASGALVRLLPLGRLLPAGAVRGGDGISAGDGGRDSRCVSGVTGASVRGVTEAAPAEAGVRGVTGARRASGVLGRE